MGSVHYTSPEQARGGFSDQRSDIYSIGITLFEMVTGQVPLSDGLRVYIGNEEFQIAVEGGRSQSTRLYKNAEGSYE